MIEVRIRHEGDATAIRLFDWDPKDMDGALRVLTEWGVRHSSTGEQFASLDSFQGEIVIEDGAAFFEIVCTVGDDSRSGIASLRRSCPLKSLSFESRPTRTT